MVDSLEGMLESAPELLKLGLEVYDTLKTEMQKALGFKAYAEHLSHITLILKEVNRHLDDKERAIVEKLDEAYRHSQEGIDKASVVVSVIKEQSNTLVLVLSESAPGTDERENVGGLPIFL